MTFLSGVHFSYRVTLCTLHSNIEGVVHICIDEVHERDLNTDFLLVLVRCSSLSWIFRVRVSPVWSWLYIG
jgi:hypothetical protein